MTVRLLKPFFLLGIITFPVIAFCQQDWNWCFGDSIKLHWDTVGNYTVSRCDITSFEVAASISDKNGNLLYYTNQFQFWNAHDSIIPNCDTIYPIGWPSSFTNGVLILPFPDDSTKFYAFTFDFGVLNFVARYYIIDKTANNGNGAILLPNNLILTSDSCSEKLAAVRHANGRDWWLVLENQNGGTFYKFLIDPTGIHGPFYQFIGSISQGAWSGGEMEFSKQGNKLATVFCSGVVDVFDFDRCTGFLSNWQAIGDTFIHTINNPNYGCAFSPNGKLLYITDNKNLWQYNLEVDTIPIPDTKKKIYHNPTTNYLLGQLQLNPAGQLVVAGGYEYYPTPLGPGTFMNTYLGIIKQPDSVGLACDFDNFSNVYLGGFKSTIGLPNLPNYNLGKMIGSPCDTLNTATTLVANSSGIKFYPNPTNGKIYFTQLPFEKVNVELVNVMGEKMLSHFVSITQPELDLSWLPDGIYFLKLSDEKGNQLPTQKIIKQ